MAFYAEGKMIKNIVFDMGGVLIYYKPEKMLHDLFDEETAQIALKEIFRNELWREKDRGVVTPDEIMEIAGPKIPKKDYDKISDMTHNLYPYMKPFDDMYEFIKQLKGMGYGIYLLSNASGDFYESKDTIPALSFFDGYLISADWKLLKPEKEIYEKLFSMFNLKPEECVFIDDVPENVEGSEKAGMKAFCYDHGNIEILKAQFREMGII